MPYPVTPPDGSTWSLDVEKTDDGVALFLVYELGGQLTKLRLGMVRQDSRLFARAVLAAGGDATERTFTGGSSGEGRQP